VVFFFQFGGEYAIVYLCIVCILIRQDFRVFGVFQVFSQAVRGNRGINIFYIGIELFKSKQAFDIHLFFSFIVFTRVPSQCIRVGFSVTVSIISVLGIMLIFIFIIIIFIVKLFD